MIDTRRRFFLRGRLSEAATRRAPAAEQRPPWAAPEALFTDLCSRCHACIKACPRQVLSAGDGGFPRMDFSQQGCDLCGACEAACQSLSPSPPTGQAPSQPRPLDRAAARLRTSPASDAHTAWPGWVLSVSAQCLAQHQVECRACADACDANAIRFRPAPGGIAQMQLTLPACIGCGECVGVCPTHAIRITAVIENGT